MPTFLSLTLGSVFQPVVCLGAGSAFTAAGVSLVRFAGQPVTPAANRRLAEHRILWSPVFPAQSPDGKYLASGAIDGIINIFDIATGKLLHTLEGVARFILCKWGYQITENYLFIKMLLNGK